MALYWYLYGVAATMWHAIERTLLPAVTASMGYLVFNRIRNRQKDAINATSVVEGLTDIQPTGVRSEKVPFNEIKNLVIHTNSTTNLGVIFEDATLFPPEKLGYFMRKAAMACDDDKPMPPQHIRDILQSKSRIVRAMPKRIAEYFGHYSEDRRDEIFDEMARCSRNYRSEQLTPEWVRRQKLDPNGRERRVYEREKTIWLYQASSGSGAFTLSDIPKGMETFEFPNKEDTRIMLADPDNPIDDQGSYLHDRVAGLKAVLKGLDDPDVKAFFTRWTEGELETVDEPPPLTKDQLSEVAVFNLYHRS